MMGKFVYENRTYTLEPNETVLKCLMRHAVEYPHSCQAGTCQSCLMKTKIDEVNPAWQKGLPETLQAQGYFLACMAAPQCLFQVSVPDENDCEFSAKILDKKLLNHNVMQVKITLDDLSPWVPGQFLHLINPHGVIRSYSIANLPTQDGFIELHIKIKPDGLMSQWLMEDAKPLEQVKLRGPFGCCFYINPKQLSFDMLLVGTGTGLAPLVAIIKSALLQHHPGSITLVHGGLTDEDIYYQAELEQLSAYFPSFVYDVCVLQSHGRYKEASIEKYMLAYLKHPRVTQVYVCGPKETTQKLKKQAFLAGVSSQAIFSDEF